MSKKFYTTRKIQELNFLENVIEKEIFITIDLDWALDFVIEDCMNILEKYSAKATFLITHESPLLERIRNDERYELGIHPNLEDRWDSEDNLASLAMKRFSALLEIVPEAQSYRSHSTTNSSRILEMAKNCGLKYDLNYFIPYKREFYFQHWRIWNDMTRVPFFWGDDIFLLEQPQNSKISFEEMTQWKGIKVFNFHPIHIFLNTQDFKDYEKIRDASISHSELLNYRKKEYGTRDKFIELLNLVSR